MEGKESVKDELKGFKFENRKSLFIPGGKQRECRSTDLPDDSSVPVFAASPD